MGMKMSVTVAVLLSAAIARGDLAEPVDPSAEKAETGRAHLVDDLRPFVRLAKGRPVFCVNADNDHFFKREILTDELPVEWRFTERGLDRYLDIVTANGKGTVTHFFMCPVGQRADYDSKACDPIWQAIREAEMLGLEPNQWPVNAKRLHDAGLDCFAYWIPRLRARGVSPWISMRMNDVHHLDRVWNMRTNRFWYNHPELRRNRGTDPTFSDGGMANALDYSFPAVREFEFGIFRELVDRYDADGFELDWMRHCRHLTPGREREQAHFLTEFMRRCRAYVDAKAVERGHGIQLSVRVPTTYETARAWGFDPETWAREGLVEMIAPANLYNSVDYDFDLASWKDCIKMANPRVLVIPCACDCLCCGGTYPVETDTAARRGWVDNMLAQGAEGLYFFNVAYGSTDVQKDVYGTGFLQSAQEDGERRYVASYHDCAAEGLSDGKAFPRPYSEGATAEIVVGRQPAAGDHVEVVVVGMDGEPESWQVTLNGCDPTGEPVNRDGWSGRWLIASERGTARGFAFTANVVKKGRNAIRIGPTGGKGRFVWCEMSVVPMCVERLEDGH